MGKTLFAVSFLAAFTLAPASAQEIHAAIPGQAQAHAHAQNEASSAQDTSMGQMNMQMDQTASQLPSPHQGSGTAWQPASVQGYEWMWMRGGWELMAHGAIFADYNQQGGPRGEGKAESVNWGMLMEQHKLGAGTILFRQMFSGESLTSPHPGFPELFQTGETYHGEPLVDHQHPHNLFAELALLYTLPLAEKLSWEFYGGPSAEPALGPVTFLHRASAAELPLAPLGHHLQDSTHTSFGVVTTGLVIDRVRLEACAFNGREPNEKRWSIQLAALDSWLTRATIAPASNWTAQYSIGRLEHPEALEPGSQWRQTASVEYNRPLAAGTWATTLVWGRVATRAGCGCDVLFQASHPRSGLRRPSSLVPGISADAAGTVKPTSPLRREKLYCRNEFRRRIFSASPFP